MCTQQGQYVDDLASQTPTEHVRNNRYTSGSHAGHKVHALSVSVGWDAVTVWGRWSTYLGDTLFAFLSRVLTPVDCNSQNLVLYGAILPCSHLQCQANKPRQRQILLPGQCHSQLYLYGNLQCRLPSRPSGSTQGDLPEQWCLVCCQWHLCDR